jgi:hypothetical protein
MSHYRRYQRGRCDSSNVVDLLAKDAAFTCPIDQIVGVHASELTVRRKQLMSVSSGDLPGDSPWLTEVDFFIRQIVDSQASGTKHVVDRDQQIRLMIDNASAHYASSRVCFSIEEIPLAFAHRVADALEDLGWKTSLINGQGDRGLDVFAEMREKRVVVQCMHAVSALGQTIVQRAYDGNSLEESDYVAIVSNAGFTWSARWRAAATRVILIHHHELTQLEERIFGTDRWRSIAPRRPSAATGDHVSSLLEDRGDGVTISHTAVAR